MSFGGVDVDLAALALPSSLGKDGHFSPLGSITHDALYFELDLRVKNCIVRFTIHSGNRLIPFGKTSLPVQPCSQEAALSKPSFIPRSSYC